MAAHTDDKHSDDHAHGPAFYVKIWAILLVLFAISVIGPEFGHKTITLITAFGIAIVKAWMVGVYFMHIRVEKRYIPYMLFSFLAILGVFWAAVSVDVEKKAGQNWTNVAAEELIQEHKENPAEGGHH